jgi:hypothetical protein
LRSAGHHGLTIISEAILLVMSGSDHEPTPGSEQVVEQMREATDRLREQAWLLAPLTSVVSEMDVAADRAPKV